MGGRRAALAALPSARRRACCSSLRAPQAAHGGIRRPLTSSMAAGARPALPFRRVSFALPCLTPVGGCLRKLPRLLGRHIRHCIAFIASHLSHSSHSYIAFIAFIAFLHHIHRTRRTLTSHCSHLCTLKSGTMHEKVAQCTRKWHNAQESGTRRGVFDGARAGQVDALYRATMAATRP